ncbi:glycosyltransferase family 2 protein [Spirulina subsalsa FACHB-351]|uniref:Glycosyltransferase family 2 protein n=1 Tax=Spirulina subsalsa FACHB-351 TaxID=234711 RepID=A0ABT3L7P0_9CYAN|nr:glycosyltransferase family 2 protein [Spirulina subsalsa]MCW6036970.1 glycosyltransferase family 2 protein [Spirulina subsalsa FACHB-351]
MSDNFWSNPEESDLELDPLTSLLAEWSDPAEDEEDFNSDFFLGLEGRRRKAAFTLIMIWGIVIALHLVAWGTWLVLSVTGILAVYCLRLILAKPAADPLPLTEGELAAAPTVSLLVAAKNEEAVIGRLVQTLCAVDYPQDKYEVWVIDDASSDRTPELLDALALDYPQLRVVHRPPNAGGGKSGALNQVLPQTQGDIIGVFDADAVVAEDILRRVVPMFQPENVGAVQVRKAITNAALNFWTKGQATEMALDSYFQQQRVAIGGIGELRGNGQFVRRKALASCGGWNEETITDDLDLTIRLHLDDWDIDFCLFPAVYEEGVTRPQALWHQRSRWAEGGYQRYLDYWRLMVRKPMGFVKTLDLLMFVMTQYIFPTALVPDVMMMLLRHHGSVLAPLSALTVPFAFVGMSMGLSRINRPSRFSFAQLLGYWGQSLRGTLYMCHWIVVMVATTGRMSIRPKRLKWVKTVHQGSEERLA